MTTISEQMAGPEAAAGTAAELAADGPQDDAAGPGDAVRDVPSDPVAVAVFTAHKAGDVLRHLSRAADRMKAARDSSGDVRAHHAAHLERHLKHAQKSARALKGNLERHYPDEAAELGMLKRHIGLARAVSGEAKSATTAHLTETTLHELAHARRHAQAMTADRDPGGEEWAFNADHAEKHLAGAAEHAGKVAEHLKDNYPLEARWLHGLDSLAGTAGEGSQHARYTGAKGMAPAGTISAQMAEGGEGPGHRPAA